MNRNTFCNGPGIGDDHAWLEAVPAVAGDVIVVRDFDTSFADGACAYWPRPTR